MSRSTRSPRRARLAQRRGARALILATLLCACPWLGAQTAPAASVAELQVAAQLANGRGQHALAVDLLRRVLDQRSRELGADHPGLLPSVMNLAMGLSNRGQLAEAQLLFDRAERLAQRNPSDIDRARLLTYLAAHAAQSGQAAGVALAAASRAVQAWRDVLELALSTTQDLQLADGAPADMNALRGELAMALNMEAAMALRANDQLMAWASARQAQALLSGTPGLPVAWRADVMVTLGRISAAQGRLAAAEVHLRSAIELRSRLLGDGPALAQAWLALAAAYQTEAMNAAARQAYAQAWAVLRRAPQSAAEVLDADTIVSYARLVSADAGVAASEQAQVFELLQWLRPEAVEQTVAQTAARLTQDDPRLKEQWRALDDAQREHDLAVGALAREFSLPDAERNRRIEDTLVAQRDAARARVEQLRQALKRDHPQFDAWTTPQPHSLASVQQRLQPDEALLWPVLGQASGLMVMIDRDGVQWRGIRMEASALREAVQGLRRGLEIREATVPDYDLAQAHALYRTLLEPLEPALRAKRHLLTLGAGPLASLPWAVLVTQGTQGTQGTTTGPGAPRDSVYAGAAWLGKRWAVTQLSGVAGLGSADRARTAAARAPRAMLAVGAPTLLGSVAAAGNPQSSALASSCRDEGPASAEAVSALAPLPQTADELMRAQRFLGGADRTELLLGSQATEANLRRQELSQYRVLYFATHGLLPGELRCRTEPALVLTPPGRSSSRADDGLLEASEIAGLRLNADLVVLSACNTGGSGTRLGGDALSGLAEAFFYAGARTLLVTHWSVPSEATSVLMGSVFERMSGAAPATGVAMALQAAQDELRRDPRMAHPVFWGGFAVVGDGAQAAR